MTIRLQESKIYAVVFIVGIGRTPSDATDAVKNFVLTTKKIIVVSKILIGGFLFEWRVCLL